MEKGLIVLSIVAATILISGCAEKPVYCTEDAKQCPDGSYVGRDPKNNCEFYPCPELPPATQPPPGAQYCDATIKCSEGMECYDFPDQDKPICYPGDPCNWCPTGKCILLESYPPQVRCE